MSRIKESVRLVDLQPQMLIADIEVNRIFSQWGYYPMITSGSDSKHREDSKHYCGEALDYRISHVHDSDRLDIYNALKFNLAPLFQVILEPDHIHIEYDPR